MSMSSVRHVLIHNSPFFHRTFSILARAALLFDYTLWTLLIIPFLIVWLAIATKISRPFYTETMSIRYFSPITSLLLFLSVLATVTDARTIYSPINLLRARQQQTDQSICAEYSTVANLSIVAANATYRAAYLKASTEGTDPTTAPLDAALAQLPNFQFNTTVNKECGNLTEVAIEGAATNFTQGVVLQENINSAVQIGARAMGMAMIMAIVVGGSLV